MDTNTFISMFPHILREGMLKDSFFNESKIIPSEILDEKDAYIISMDLPGVKKGDVDIALKDSDILRISISENSNRYQKSEKSFRLSKSCDLEKISADLEDGILKIKIGKKESFKEKKIKLS